MGNKEETKNDTDFNDTNIPSIITFSEDISEQEAPEPLPVGEYRLVIAAVEPKESKKKGTAYAEVTFLVSADQFPVDFEGNENGELIVYRRASLEDNPRSRFLLRHFLESIGAPMAKNIDLTDWLGLECMGTITHEIYEGVTKHVIDRVNPV